MRQFPTLEELKDMSIPSIQALDIQSKEEEERVQKILTMKMKDAPVAQQVYRGDVPDIKTKEEELRWQAIIDKRENSLRPQDHMEETEIDLDKMPPIINEPASEIFGATVVTPESTDTAEFGDLADDEEEETADEDEETVEDDSETETETTEPVERTEEEVQAEIAALEGERDELLGN